MDSKAQIEAMARKYKEEMLRMYKQSGKTNEAAAEKISPPRNIQPARPEQTSPPKKSPLTVQPVNPTAGTAVLPPKTERIITPNEALASTSAEKGFAEKPAQEMNTPKFPSPEEIMREELGGSAEESAPKPPFTRENSAAEPRNFQGNYNSEEFSDLSDPLEPRYRGEEDGTPDKSGIGYIKAEVTTGGGAVPIENAVVLITGKENGKTHLLKMLITDESGSTETVALPAPNVSFSETPDPTEKPFANYYISAYANGFYAENDMEVPVFSGVKSIQPIALIPKASDDSRFMLN